MVVPNLFYLLSTIYATYSRSITIANRPNLCKVAVDFHHKCADGAHIQPEVPEIFSWRCFCLMLDVATDEWSFIGVSVSYTIPISMYGVSHLESKCSGGCSWNVLYLYLECLSLDLSISILVGDVHNIRVSLWGGVVGRTNIPFSSHLLILSTVPLGSVPYGTWAPARNLGTSVPRYGTVL